MAIMKNKYSVILDYNHSNLLSHYFHKDPSSPCSLHPVSHLHTFSLMLSTLPRLPLLTRDNSYSDFDSRNTFIFKDIFGIPSLHLNIITIAGPSHCTKSQNGHSRSCRFWGTFWIHKQHLILKKMYFKTPKVLAGPSWVRGKLEYSGSALGREVSCKGSHSGDGSASTRGNTEARWICWGEHGLCNEHTSTTGVAAAALAFRTSFLKMVCSPVL